MQQQQNKPLPQNTHPQHPDDSTTVDDHCHFHRGTQYFPGLLILGMWKGEECFDHKMKILQNHTY